ncbi:Cardiolipin synthase [Mycoplasma suis KI3806]|nr:Cardiolipin synthase [Mycoplasma suis KI3806]
MYSNFGKSNLLLNFYFISFILLPFIFPFLYFLMWMDKLSDEAIKKFKEKIKVFQDFEKKTLSPSIYTTLAPYNSDDLDKVIRYNYVSYQRPLSKNNSIKFVVKPKDHITCIINLIKRAKKFIHIEYYVFSEGYVFNYIVQLLSKKVQEGVEVKLIVDGWGNYKKISKRTSERLKSLGIQYRVFNPLFKKSKELWWNFRNHNKLLIVDNEFALFGSCNISDEYFNITDKFFPTTELSIVLEGEIVNSLNLLFAFHWSIIKVEKKKEFDMLLSTSHFFPQAGRKCGNIALQLINSSPFSLNQPIKTNLLQLIFSAKKSIKISTPYFYPPQDIVNALRIADQLGVRIQIILPKEADLNDRILRVHREILSSFYSETIEIYEYFGFNHEKFTIIDEETVYFGTYNWDYRSFYWNFESALIIKNKEAGLTVNKLFEESKAKSHRMKDFELVNTRRIFPNIFIGVARWCQAMS